MVKVEVRLVLELSEEDWKDVQEAGLGSMDGGVEQRVLMDEGVEKLREALNGESGEVRVV